MNESHHDGGKPPLIVNKKDLPKKEDKKDEFNIVDPFLCIMGAEVNNSNGMQISAVLMFFYLIGIFIIYNLFCVKVKQFK